MYALLSMPIRGYHRRNFSCYRISQYVIIWSQGDYLIRRDDKIVRQDPFRYPYNRSFWAQQKHIIIYLNLSKCFTMHFTRCKFILSFFHYYFGYLCRMYGRISRDWVRRFFACRIRYLSDAFFQVYIAESSSIG